MVRNIKYFILGLMLIMVSACKVGNEIEALKEVQDSQKIWVFAQLNVPQENNKIEDYYYFAQINESLYKKIKNQKIKEGFIVFQKTRYWSKDDVIKSIADEMYSDEMLFRIEDIRKIDLVKKEPKIGFKYGGTAAEPDNEKTQEVKTKTDV
jgi:hypothetical protein